MTRLRTAPAARQDICDIRAYSKARFGTAAGRQYLEGLSAAFDRLAERPFTGIGEHDLGGDMRSIAYRSHRIYYQLNGDDLLVVRILHHARDISAVFGQPQ